MVESIPLVVSQQMHQHLFKKFVCDRGWSEKFFATTLQEFSKFFCLAAESNGSFLPTTEAIDEIWHAYVLETEEYQELCERVTPDQFLHHRSLTYKDYASNRSSEELLSEDLSWLASYVANFGGHTSESLEYWPFAKHLSERQNWAIGDLNRFAKELLKFQTPAADTNAVETYPHSPP